jgi:predicted RNA-binding protein
MNEPRPIKYWIVVVSKDHVEIGKKLGIVQANHGKAAPVKRMKPGDYVIYYSPKIAYEGKEPLKQFTAIARVKEGDVYEAEMGPGRITSRRDVTYLPCNPVDIKPLIPELSFIRKKESWGFVFRYGFFEIPKVDFDLISGTMEARGLKPE